MSSKITLNFKSLPLRPVRSPFLPYPGRGFKRAGWGNDPLLVQAIKTVKEKG